VMKKLIVFAFLFVVSACLIAQEKAPVSTLSGHSGAVNSVAITSDGKRIVTGGEDMTLRLWNTSDGKCINVLSGHSGPISTIACSPDGTLAVSGSDDKTIRLWRLSDGRCIKVLSGHSKYVMCVVFSPDGQYVASASMDKSVRIWRISTGECALTLDKHTEPVTAIDYSPDGKFIASASGLAIKIWQISNSENAATFTGHSDAILSICYSPNGKYIASCSNQQIKVWRVANGECVDTFTGHTDDIKSLAYTHDGQYLISGSNDATVKLWDMTSGECIRTIHAGAAVNSVAVSNDGRYIASAGGAAAKVWKMDPDEWRPAPVKKQEDLFTTVMNLKKGEEKSKTAQQPNISQKQAQSSGKPAAVPARKETAAAASVPVPVAQEPVVSSAAVSAGECSTVPSGTSEVEETGKSRSGLPVVIIVVCVIVLAGAVIVFIFIMTKAKWRSLPRLISEAVSRGDAEGAAELFMAYKKGFFSNKPDIGKFRPETLFGIYNHTDSLKELFKNDFPESYWITFVKLLISVGKYEQAFSLAAKFSLQELSAQETVKMYLETGRAGDLTPSNLPVSQFLWYMASLIEQGNSAEAVRLAEGSLDYLLGDKTFGKETFQNLREHSKSVLRVVYSPDGEYLASGSLDKTIKIWKNKASKSIKTLSDISDWIYSVAFSVDGSFIIGGISDGTIKFWDTRDYSSIRTISAHKDSVMALAFSPDGKIFISGGADSKIIMWDLDKGEKVRQIVAHTSWVKALTFMPSGDYFVSGSADNYIKVWKVSTGENSGKFDGHVWGGINSLSLSPDGKYLASTGDDKTIRIWNTADFTAVTALEGHADAVLTAAFSPDGTYLVSGSSDKTMKIWRVQDFRCLKTVYCHTGPVMSVGFSPDSRLLVSGSADTTVKVFEMSTLMYHTADTVKAVFDIFDKSGKADYFLSFLSTGRSQPEVYSVIADLLSKRGSHEQAASALEAKNKYHPKAMTDSDYNTAAAIAEAIRQHDASGSTGLQQKYHEEFLKSLKTLGKPENKE
jgi:WD40 repeat protein